MVDKMLVEHPLLFHSIKKKITQPADLFPIFTEMYGDGTFVATFAICCAVGTEENARAFVKVLERFVKGAPNLAQWILDNGGWDGFCQTFEPLLQEREPSVEQFTARLVSFLFSTARRMLNYFY